MLFSNEHTIYILSYFIFNISMIEFLILILNAYYFFFYELLFDQLNYNETKSLFVYFSSRIKHH